jgi:hypothetical protein
LHAVNICQKSKTNSPTNTFSDFNTEYYSDNITHCKPHLQTIFYANLLAKLSAQLLAD